MTYARTKEEEKRSREKNMPAALMINLHTLSSPWLQRSFLQKKLESSDLIQSHIFGQLFTYTKPKIKA